jgi:hypothetical protein
MSKTLTRSQLKKWLSYDPETGQFTRQIEGAAVALRPRKRLSVDGDTFLAKHLAWLWMKGAVPKKTIVHLNDDRLDFRWSNLALANPSQLRARRKSWGKHGKGVSFEEGRPKPYRAIVYSRAKKGNHHLGSFQTHAEAEAAVTEWHLKTYGRLVRSG